MVESKRSYEECRKQRLEENKKRMEELNIGKLALALKASSPNTSPVKFIIITLSLSLSLSVFILFILLNYFVRIGKASEATKTIAGPVFRTG